MACERRRPTCTAAAAPQCILGQVSSISHLGWTPMFLSPTYPGCFSERPPRITLFGLHNPASLFLSQDQGLAAAGRHGSWLGQLAAGAPPRGRSAYSCSRQASAHSHRQPGGSAESIQSRFAAVSVADLVGDRCVVDRKKEKVVHPTPTSFLSSPEWLVVAYRSWQLPTLGCRARWHPG